MSMPYPHNPKKRPNNGSDEQYYSRACDQCRSRKVKCDRRQPECSNCSKSGMSCGFSDMLKRVNYAKRLHDEFSMVISHVEKLESTVAKLPEQIAQSLLSSSASGASSSPTNSKSRFPSREQNSILTPRESETNNDDSSITWKPNFERVEIAHGGERVVGYPAALTLFSSIKRHLIRALTTTIRDTTTDVKEQHYLTSILQARPFLQPEFEKQLHSFPFTGVCNDPAITHDGRSLSTPPRTLLGPAIEYFIEHINSHIPIFDETALRELADVHYADMDKSRNPAEPLILNCIILLSLKNGGSQNGIPDSHMGTMSEDLIPSFRRNCDRALARLSEFTQPCQCNVQALMTLALVARDYYGCMVFEKVCQVASQVVRFTGLTLARRPPPSSWEKMNQSEKLFWAMYMLDKQRVFLSGHPCDLYLFDTDLQLASCGEEATYHERLNAATIHLSTILEEIYIALYSCRGARASTSHRSRQAEMLRNSVNDWSLQHHSVIHQVSSSEAPLGGDALQIELKYSYHVTQILINRCDTSDDSQQQIIFHARNALKIIYLLSSVQPLTVSHLVALKRIFRNYPSVPFHDLLAICLTQGLVGREEDLFLLRSTRDAYQVVHEPNTPFGTPERPYIGFNWCIDLLNLVDNAEQYGKEKMTPPSTFTFQPVNRLDGGVGSLSTNAYHHHQFNPIIQGGAGAGGESKDNVPSSNCVPPQVTSTGTGTTSLLNGLPNNTTTVPPPPPVNGPPPPLEAGFFDFDFYQRLFQQVSWDMPAPL